MHRRRRLAAGLAAALISLSAVSACASKESDDSSSGTSTEDAKVIDITIEGDTTDPNGKRIGIAVNQPVTINIDADAAGELHVHSKPEQEIAYPEGTSSHELTIDKPGIVAVESHDLGTTLIELEVR